MLHKTNIFCPKRLHENPVSGYEVVDNGSNLFVFVGVHYLQLFVAPVGEGAKQSQVVEALAHFVASQSVLKRHLKKDIIRSYVT